MEASPAHGGARDGRVIAVAVFLALTSVVFLFVMVQWLAFRLSTPDQRMEIGEWPFVILGAALAVVPLWAAIRLATGRGGRSLGLASAIAIGVIGVLALFFALGFMSMGAAWSLLLGGAVMVIGSVATLIVLRRPI